MNSTVVSTAPQNLAAKTGPRFLAGLFHWGLFGVLTIQVYLYFIAFPDDPRRNKIIVFGIYLLEVIQTVLLTASVFAVYAAGFGDIGTYDKVELVWFTVPLMSGIVAFVAEGFYAYRIHILAGSYWVPAVVTLLACVQLGGAIASSVVLKDAKLFSHLLGPHFYVTEGIWNGGSAACDILIAVAMTYYLSQRGSGGNRSTRTVLRRVITRVIETGTVTALFALISLTLTLLPGHQTYYQAPSAILAKIYSNSMMVLFNSRMKIGSDTSANMHSNEHSKPPAPNDFEMSHSVIIRNEQMVFEDRNLMSTKGVLSFSSTHLSGDTYA